MRGFLRNTVIFGTLSGVALATSGCEGMGEHERQGLEAGCVGGLLAGLGAGLLAGHGNAKGAAIGGVSGLIVGCAAGDLIGKQLDERDRQAREAATLAALNAPPARRPAAHNWSSTHSTGNHGTVVVQATTNTSSGECKQVRETAYIQGKEVEQPVKYCRSGAEGDWKEA